MVNGFITKYFGAGIGITILLALLLPYPALQLHPLATPLLFLLMFIAGLCMDWKRANIILKRPMGIVAGNIVLYGVAPMSVYVLSRLLLTDEQYIYGVIFASLTPTAIVAPFFTGLLKGDKELSFGILVSSMLISPLLIPALLVLYAGDAIQTPALLLFKDIVLLVPLPLLLAFFVKVFFKQISSVVENNAPALNFVFLSLLIFILFGVSLQKMQFSYGLGGELLLILLIFFIQDFGLLALSRFLFLPWSQDKEKTAILLSGSMKNIAIAAGILLLYDPRAALAPGIGFIAHAFLFTPWIVKKIMRV